MAFHIRNELEIGLTSEQKELKDSIHLTAVLEVCIMHLKLKYTPNIKLKKYVL